MRPAKIPGFIIKFRKIILIDLNKKILPAAVLVNGRYYSIHTDFQFWINFYRILKTEALPMVKDFDFLYTRVIPDDRQQGFQQLLNFYNQKTELPRPSGHSTDAVLYDFDIDADLIYSAFLEQYGIDLIDENLHLHWFKFLALFRGLHNTKLNDVMGYRSFDKNLKSDYKNDMEELRRAWQIETKLSAAEQKELDEFDAQFK